MDAEWKYDEPKSMYMISKYLLPIFVLQTENRRNLDIITLTEKS